MADATPGESLVRSASPRARSSPAGSPTDDLVAAVAAVGDALVAAFAAGRHAGGVRQRRQRADAAHLAAEFVGRCTRDRRALPAIHLGDSPAAITALANDYGYPHVFERGVQAFVARGRRGRRAHHQRPVGERAARAGRGRPGWAP